MVCIKKKFFLIIQLSGINDVPCVVQQSSLFPQFFIIPETLYLRHSSSLFRFNLVPCDVYSTFRVCEFPYSKFHISKIIQQLSFGSGLFHLELVYRSRPRHIINQNFISFYSRRIVHHMDILRFIYPFIC